jgi:hypothetical protein
MGAKERPRMISPTGVADLDFSSAIDGNDDALLDDANSPLNCTAWAIKSHPLKDMRNAHSSLIRKRVTKIFTFMSKNREQYHKEMTDFLKTFLELPCYNAKDKKLIGCACLRSIKDIDQAAAFLADFSLMTKGEQYYVLKEWIISREAVRGEGSYSLRIGADPRNNNQLVMCNHSFLNVMYIGKTHWNTLLKTKLKLRPNRHGNDGNDHRS